MKDIASILSEKGLRVTPQRIAILDAIYKLDNHPIADNIINYIKTNHPNISLGTVYKVLDSFVENRLLNKIRTDNGIMRYDPLLSNHHHLYSKDSNRIEDYQDEKLDKMIKQYFQAKGIKDFKIDNITLHISGTFKK